MGGRGALPLAHAATVGQSPGLVSTVSHFASTRTPASMTSVSDDTVMRMGSVRYTDSSSAGCLGTTSVPPPVVARWASAFAKASELSVAPSALPPNAVSSTVGFPAPPAVTGSCRSGQGAASGGESDAGRAGVGLAARVAAAMAPEATSESMGGATLLML